MDMGTDRANRIRVVLDEWMWEAILWFMMGGALVFISVYNPLYLYTHECVH